MGQAVTKAQQAKRKYRLGKKKSAFKSTLTLYDGSTLQLAVKPSVETWGVIEQVPIEKWMKHCGNFGFSCLTPCTNPSSSTWYSRACLTALHFKSMSSITLQCHGHAEDKIVYAGARLLGDLLQEAVFEYMVPSCDPHRVLFFSLDSLSDTTYYLMYVWSPTSALNFHIKKSGSFQVVQCEISPDESRIIVLCSKSSSEDLGSMKDFDIQVYSKRPAAYDRNFYGNMLELEQEILGVTGCSGPPKVLFDNRFMASRFALLNVRSIQWNTVESFLCCLDLNKGRMITSSQESSTSVFKECSFIDGSYSPDGSWILIHVLKDLLTSAVSTKRGRAVIFVHSDTLEAHKCIDVCWENLQDCWTNYIPSFSRDCQQVALRFKKYMRVYRLPQPQTLQALCRIVIRNCLNDSELCRISAGKDVIDYLSCKPIQQ